MYAWQDQKLKKRLLLSEIRCILRTVELAEEILQKQYRHTWIDDESMSSLSSGPTGNATKASCSQTFGLIGCGVQRLAHFIRTEGLGEEEGWEKKKA